MKRADYELAAQNFRDMLNREAAKPEAERNFPEDADAWVRVPAIAICHNPGCQPFYNNGQGIELTVGENADGVYRIVCGNCQKRIHDLTAVFDDGRIALATGGVE